MYLLKHIPYEGKDEELLKRLNLKLIGSAQEIYETGENLLSK